jgi:4'-phosphopantetheinyl transferase
MRGASPAQVSFHLAPGEVHVWCASLHVPIETVSDLLLTLSPDERARSARLRFEHHRKRFIVARGVLRSLVARYLGADPGEISFVYDPSGKPELAPEAPRRINFNLSHSEGVVLIAITSAGRIGVDIERIRPSADYAEIARRFFSTEEVQALNDVPGARHAEAFLSCWTKKEAYLKGCGEGLGKPLNAFSVPLITDHSDAPFELCVSSADVVSGDRWSLYTLRPAPGYVAALAVEGTGWRLQEQRWSNVELNRASPRSRERPSTRTAGSPPRVDGLGGRLFRFH